MRTNCTERLTESGVRNARNASREWNDKLFALLQLLTHDRPVLLAGRVHIRGLGDGSPPKAEPCITLLQENWARVTLNNTSAWNHIGQWGYPCIKNFSSDFWKSHKLLLWWLGDPVSPGQLRPCNKHTTLTNSEAAAVISNFRYVNQSLQLAEDDDDVQTVTRRGRLTSTVSNSTCVVSSTDWRANTDDAADKTAGARQRFACRAAGSVLTPPTPAKRLAS